MFGPPLGRAMEGETGGRDSIAAARGNPREQGGQTGAVGTGGAAQSLVSTLEFPAGGWRLVPEGRRSDRVARDIVGRRPAGGRAKVLSLVVETAAALCRSASLWLKRNTRGRFAPSPLQVGDPEIERAEDHQADRGEPDDFRQRIFRKLCRQVADQLRHFHRQVFACREMFELIKQRRANDQRADEQRFHQRVGVSGPRRKAFGDQGRERDHDRQQAETEAEVHAAPALSASEYCAKFLVQSANNNFSAGKKRGPPAAKPRN